MSDTPRTDARAFSGGWYKRMDPDGRGYAKTELHLVDAEVARTLERELAAVTAERDALLAGINKHNAGCESACAARFVGADNRPCRDTYNGRMCPDCPREWIIDAALRRP